MKYIDEIQQKALKARTGLVLDQPFFGSLCLKMKVHEDPTCESVYTNGVSFGYNPQAIKDLSLQNVKALMAKSVIHLILGHHVRRGNRDENKWKKACNLIAEAIIKKAKFVLPNEDNIDLSYVKDHVENVYAKLPDDPEGDNEDQQPDPDGDDCMDGCSGGNGSGSGDGDDNDDQGDQNQDDQDQNDQDDQGQEEFPNGEVRDLPSQTNSAQASNSEKANSEQDWKIAAMQAAQTAKQMGDLPGGIERIIESLLEPSQDWRDVLREFVEKTTYGDYTWMRPNRRYFPQGLILPSLAAGLDLLKAECDVDASGSVYDKELAQFGAEISNVLEEFPQIELTVRFFDTDVKHKDTKVYTHEDVPVVLETQAGGGTDFVPIFENIYEIEKQTGESPKFLIVFTDLECSRFPKQHPDFPVLWAKVGDSDWAETPPFGEIVQIEVG